jgi:uncharacterized protein with PIN domain
MTFFADCMLGRLARWLRALGFDTAYDRRIDDRELVAVARREGRVVLTRDSGLIAKGARRADRLFIESDDWRAQVRQVLDAFGLRPGAAPHTRCLECNAPLKPLTGARARNLVAPYVLEHGGGFALCPGCGRVYWRGSHADRMDATLKGFLDEGGPKAVRKRPAAEERRGAPRDRRPRKPAVG